MELVTARIRVCPGKGRRFPLSRLFVLPRFPAFSIFHARPGVDNLPNSARVRDDDRLSNGNELSRVAGIFWVLGFGGDFWGLKFIRVESVEKHCDTA